MAVRRRGRRMTREDINDIINAICSNDEDYEKPCISPKYLRQELEQLALDQKQWNGEPTTKNDLPHCQYSDAEIAESFIEDVEAVKDQLPTKNDLAVDAISRAEAQTKIEIMRKYQQLEDFAKWVAVEVIDEELWTYNHLSFAEIACRKLVKLGIMQESDGEYTYEVVEDGNDKRREI